jgi:hypothetical protein
MRFQLTKFWLTSPKVHDSKRLKSRTHTVSRTAIAFSDRLPCRSLLRRVVSQNYVTRHTETTQLLIGFGEAYKGFRCKGQFPARRITAVKRRLKSNAPLEVHQRCAR